ncbi:hypothetical protein EON65_40765 [archaeon]|nr:MAG: hypothetical protein EON65_40765 [archaeon]
MSFFAFSTSSVRGVGTPPWSQSHLSSPRLPRALRKAFRVSLLVQRRYGGRPRRSLKEVGG